MSGEFLPSQPSVSSMGVDSLRARRRPFPTGQISQVIDGRVISSWRTPRTTVILFVRQIVSGDRAQVEIGGSLFQSRPPTGAIPPQRDLTQRSKAISDV